MLSQSNTPCTKGRNPTWDNVVRVKDAPMKNMDNVMDCLASWDMVKLNWWPI